MGILRSLRQRLILVGLALGTMCALTPGAGQADCAPEKVDVKGAFGSVSFVVDLADDPQERAQGLMFVETLPRFQGMLFIYPQEQALAFWMRNTLIPLDMVFADSTGTIVHIHENAVPLDETPIPSPVPALAVLEVNGGLTGRLGIKAGDVLRHPAFGEKNAVWPCN